MTNVVDCVQFARFIPVVSLTVLVTIGLEISR